MRLARPREGSASAPRRPGSAHPPRRQRWPRLGAVAVVACGLSASAAAPAGPGEPDCWPDRAARAHVAGAVGRRAAGPGAGQDQRPAYVFPPDRPRGDHEWRIVAVGDIMNPAVLLRTAEARRGEPDRAARGYQWPFRHVRSLVSGADLAIGNLEFPVLPGAPLRGKRPYNGDPAYLDALRSIGFDVLFTANNHAYDQGIAGIEATLTELRRRGIHTLGTDHANAARREVLTVDVGGQRRARLAFLNYTSGIANEGIHANISHLLFGRNVNYALFNRTERPTKELFRSFAGTFLPSALIADVDSFIDNVRSNIARAREQGADYAVVFLHWGQFKAPRHSDEQAELARRLCLAGADAVIGAGPHVLQPIELIDLSGEADRAAPERPYDECLVAYSLGNFISGMSPPTRTSMILELRIAQDRRGTYLRSYAPFMIRSELRPEPGTGGEAGKPAEVEIRRCIPDEPLTPEALTVIGNRE